jgi:hypothetical protein
MAGNSTVIAGLGSYKNLSARCTTWLIKLEVNCWVLFDAFITDGSPKAADATAR